MALCGADCPACSRTCEDEKQHVTSPRKVKHWHGTEYTRRSYGATVRIWIRHEWRVDI